MLQKNLLQPPRPFVESGSPGIHADSIATAMPFISAEDFDSTGILAGVDPCESLYWWIPDLYGPDAVGPARNAAPACPADNGRARGPSAGEPARPEIQATRRTASRTTAAA